MIKANELRIGNLFWDEDKNPCYYAGSWERSDGWIHRDSGNNTYKETQMYPIPLTPELLERCGAEVDGIHRVITIGASVKMKFRFYPPRVYSELSDIYLGDAIEYLHQLQNLYFALTSTELREPVE